MMTLIRKIFWVALFVVSTFCWTVLFDYGTTDYSKNMKLEYQNFKNFVGWKPAPKKDATDGIPVK